MATAQELMEQNQELSQAVSELEEQTLEEQVLAKLKEIEAILTKLDGESIDLSVFLEQIQSFSDEKKAELQALVDKLDNPLGNKTITMDTIRQNAIAGAYVYQEVYKKDGAITKYGDFIVRGYIDDNMLQCGSSGQEIRLPFPNDVEFEFLFASYHNYYAIPKAGQNNVGGISGSLDNYVFSLGYGGYGQLGTGSTADKYTPYPFKFESRPKKLIATGQGSAIKTSVFVLLENGKLYACGANTDYIFGIGNSTQSNSWIEINSGVDNIFAGSTNLFIVKGDTLYGTGYNGAYQLGVGSDTSYRVTPAQIKTGFSELQDLKCFAEYQSSYWYITTFAMIDGELWGAGRNGHYQISSSSTSDITNLTRVTDGFGVPLNTPSGTKFMNHPLLTIILIPNNGNTDLYVSGYGEYGFGDGTSDTATKLKKIKTFDGLGWDILSNFSEDNYQDSIDSIFIVNREKQKIYAWGYNNVGNLGVGTYGQKNTIEEVILPSKGKEQFEAHAVFGADNEGSLCVIIDGVLYVCGDADYGRISRQTAILSPVAMA